VKNLINKPIALIPGLSKKTAKCMQSGLKCHRAATVPLSSKLNKDLTEISKLTVTAQDLSNSKKMFNNPKKMEARAGYQVNSSIATEKN